MCQKELLQKMDQLKGKVLAIGGVKEKLIAARRSNIDTIIFPKDNKPDFDELPDYLKKGIEVHFVENYDEVFQVAFKQKAGKKK